MKLSHDMRSRDGGRGAADPMEPPAGSASRHTRCQRGRLGAGSRRLARVGPGCWQGGPDGTGRLGPGLAELAGPEGPGWQRRKKAGGGGERNDENTAEPGGRIAAVRLRRRRRADQIKQKRRQISLNKSNYRQNKLSPNGRSLKTLAASALQQGVCVLGGRGRGWSIRGVSGPRWTAWGRRALTRPAPIRAHA